MCGIIGIVGLPGAAGLARKGIETLEYRGYDSAGIAWLAEEGIDVQKEIGRVSELPPTPAGKERIAIGHTRWATHGGVTKANAHPHLDGTGKFAVIHNGTLEHHHALRARLQAAGHTFLSETDSEVLVHLYERERQQGEPHEALEATLAQLEGTWAFLILDSEAEAIAFACNKAPLMVGFGNDGALLLASDATALLPHTRKVGYLDQGDRGIASAKGLQVWDKDGKPKTLKVTTIDWDAKQAERAGYPHFMLKEIMDAPTAINQCLAGRLHADPLRIETGAGALLKGVKRIRIVGSGTSHHAAMMGVHFFEQWAGIPSQAILASELRDRLLPTEPGLLTIAVSQSGETFDTLEAIRHVESQGVPVLAITNHQGSTLQRMADGTVLTRVGPEVGVAATKTLLGQIATLALLALETGLQTRHLPPSRLAALAAELERMPRTMEAVLLKEPELRELARKLAGAKSLFFLGRGIHVATALEAALKFKEITYLHAEGFGAGELKHGTFALLDDKTPCVFFVPAHGATKALTTVFEVSARGAPCHVILQDAAGDLEGPAETIVRLPVTDVLLASMPMSLAGQLLAYHAAAGLGRPVDRPRNLAKSVTVA